MTQRNTVALKNNKLYDPHQNIDYANVILIFQPFYLY